jgi:hypothetical protein
MTNERLMSDICVLTMIPELVWPLSSDPMPEGLAIREDAAKVFRWQ